MKYQIYLDKETSILVNDLAQKNNNKPSTFIKRFVEGFMKIYKASEGPIMEALEKEKIKDGNKQPKV